MNTWTEIANNFLCLAWLYSMSLCYNPPPWLITLYLTAPRIL